MSYDELRNRLRAEADKECGEGATSATIADAEEALGLTFPPDYRSFLIDFGWLQVGPTEIFGLGEGVPGYLDVVQMATAERRDAPKEVPGNLLPIMNDGGGNLCCLDCNEASAPVVVWDHTSGATRLKVGFVDWLAESMD